MDFPTPAPADDASVVVDPIPDVVPSPIVVDAITPTPYLSEGELSVNANSATGKTNSSISYLVLFIVGAAVLGGILLVFAKSKESKEESPRSIPIGYSHYDFDICDSIVTLDEQRSTSEIYRDNSDLYRNTSQIYNSDFYSEDEGSSIYSSDMYSGSGLEDGRHTLEFY